MKLIDYHKFKNLLEEFVGDNFIAEDLCPMCSDNCSPIIPNDFDDFDRQLKELYIKMMR